MVYMTAEDLTWEPFLNTWLETHFKEMDFMTEALIAHLRTNLFETFKIGLAWIREYGDEPIKTTDLQQVTTVTRFIEAFVDPTKGFKGKEDEKKKHLDCICCYAFTWGLGGQLTQKSKEKFDSVIREEWKQAQIPLNGTCFDFFYDMKKEKVFKPWAGKVQPFVYDKEASFFDLMVPTVDTTKYAFLLETLMSMRKPMFFTGNTGVGKSAMIANQLAVMKARETIMPIFINMSAQTSSGRTQVTVEEKLEKKGRTAIGPPVGKKLAVFVDDINMP
jgi:dynein heavy chain